MLLYTDMQTRARKQDGHGSLVARIVAPAATLVERHDAYGSLVLNFQDMAYACAFAVLSDADLAQDAAQEAFLTAWRKLHLLRDPEAFPGWFRMIVVNEAARVSRKQAPAVPLDDRHRTIASHNNPEHAIESHERTAAVNAAID